MKLYLITDWRGRTYLVYGDNEKTFIDVEGDINGYSTAFSYNPGMFTQL